MNPEHLEPVTAAVNARRAAARIFTCINGHPKTPATRNAIGACTLCVAERNRRRSG